MRLDLSVVHNLVLGVYMRPSTVDFLFQSAINRMVYTDGETPAVRVVPALVWAEWQAWAEAPVPPGTVWEPGPLPSNLEAGGMVKHDGLLIPWYHRGHYSTLFLTNMRTPCTLNTACGACVAGVGPLHPTLTCRVMSCALPCRGACPRTSGPTYQSCPHPGARGFSGQAQARRPPQGNHSADHLSGDEYYRGRGTTSPALHRGEILQCYNQGDLRGRVKLACHAHPSLPHGAGAK